MYYLLQLWVANIADQCYYLSTKSCILPYKQSGNSLSVLQWNPSKTDTIGEIIFVLYKEVSFIQGFLNYDIFNLSHNS